MCMKLFRECIGYVVVKLMAILYRLSLALHVAYNTYSNKSVGRLIKKLSRFVVVVAPVSKTVEK